MPGVWSVVPGQRRLSGHRVSQLFSSQAEPGLVVKALWLLMHHVRYLASLRIRWKCSWGELGKRVSVFRCVICGKRSKFLGGMIRRFSYTYLKLMTCKYIYDFPLLVSSYIQMVLASPQAPLLNTLLPLSPHVT